MADSEGESVRVECPACGARLPVGRGGDLREMGCPACGDCFLVVRRRARKRIPRTHYLEALGGRAPGLPRSRALWVTMGVSILVALLALAPVILRHGPGLVDAVRMAITGGEPAEEGDE